MPLFPGVTHESRKTNMTGEEFGGQVFLHLHSAMPTWQLLGQLPPPADSCVLIPFSTDLALLTDPSCSPGPPLSSGLLFSHTALLFCMDYNC